MRQLVIPIVRMALEGLMGALYARPAIKYIERLEHP
jgi:hypothetical protein